MHDFLRQVVHVSKASELSQFDRFKVFLNLTGC